MSLVSCYNADSCYRTQFERPLWASADSAQTDGTGVTYEAAVAAVPTVKHVQDLVDSIPRVSQTPVFLSCLPQPSCSAGSGVTTLYALSP